VVDIKWNFAHARPVGLDLILLLVKFRAKQRMVDSGRVRERISSTVAFYSQVLELAVPTRLEIFDNRCTRIC